MDQQTAIQILDQIVCAIEEAGYDARAQLTGYLQEGDPTFITRRNGAREQIMQLDKALIRSYLNRLP